MAAVVGFAFLVMVATPVGKRIFLLVITTITNAMRCMATTAGMVKKAAVGRSKSPPLAVKKTVACSGSPKRARKKRCYISTRNKLITFSTGASRTFFTANGGLFVSSYASISREYRSARDTHDAYG